MRKLILTILPITALFLQSTIFSTYSIKGTVPDMLLIFAVFYALFNNSTRGTAYGIVCGLLEDLYMGRFIGLNAISKGIVAYAVSKFRGNLFHENVMVGVVTVLVSTLLNSILVILIALTSFEVFNLNSSILTSILYQTCYNTILSIPLYIWYYNSSRTGLLRATGD